MHRAQGGMDTGSMGILRGTTGHVIGRCAEDGPWGQG